MQNEFQMDKLKEYLKSVPALSSTLGTRIYRGQPNGEPTGTYFTLTMVGEEQNYSTKGTLVEFRFQAHNEVTTFKQLIDIKNQVSYKLMETSLNMGGMIVYGVSEGQPVQLVDDKFRKEIVMDYTFYFTR